MGRIPTHENRDPKTSVGTLISDAYAIKVRENRMYIGQIIEILRFTAGVSLREAMMKQKIVKIMEIS